MLNFCARHGNLRPLSRLAVVALAFFVSVASARESCPELDSPPAVGVLQDWNALAAISESELSLRIRAALDAHPLTAQFRAKFEAGADLEFQADFDQRAGGWLIQGYFLKKIMKHIFPAAQFVLPRHTERLMINIDDSTFGPLDHKTQFDMVDLKILNGGPSLPDKNQLRTAMSLPHSARIASVYEALKTSMDNGDVVRALFDKNLVDIVVLSSQVKNSFQKHEWHGEVPLFTTQQWIKMHPTERPARAIVFNDTYRRMPYVHAASDFVVVLGEANMFEPIHAGRPTYFDKHGWGDARSVVAWKRIVKTASKSGLGYPITGEKDLIAHRTAHANERAAGAITKADLDLALTNVLQALSEVLATDK